MISISWSSSLCHCFSDLVEVVEIFSHQRLYEIHQQFSIFSRQCHWFIQNEQERQYEAAQARWKAQMKQAVTQAFRVCFKASEQQQQVENQARIAKEQQRAEQARLAKEAEETRLEKERLEAFACRRCPAKFPSNTKLHEHIRNHHAKKPKAALPTPSNPPTSSTLPALSTPSAAPSMSSQISSTPPATPPSTPKRTYLTMDDLFAMFTGRPKPIGLLHRPRNPFPPYNWRISKPSTPQTRIIFYFLPVTSKKSKDRNKLASNRQSSFAAEKLIDVGRIGPKRAPAVSSTSSWISRNQRHSAWTFPTYPSSRNTIPIGTRAGKPWDNYGTTRASSFSKKYGQIVTIWSEIEVKSIDL